MAPDGGDKRQLTFFEGDGVRAASLGLAGRRLVLERGTDLYLFEPGAGEPRRLEIGVAADQLENPVVVETKTGDADDLAVADDGDELALTIAGEIVLLNREQGGRAVVAVPGPRSSRRPRSGPAAPTPCCWSATATARTPSTCWCRAIRTSPGCARPAGTSCGA